MKEYKKGDKVRVRTDLVLGEDYDKMQFVREMVEYKGKEVTIADVYHYDPLRYEIEEDDCGSWWTNDMFVQPKTSNKVKIAFEGMTTVAKMGDKQGIANCNPTDKYNEAEGLRVAVCRLFDVEPFTTTVVEKPIEDYSLEELLNNLAERV